jgi:hypothetical protein
MHSDHARNETFDPILSSTEPSCGTTNDHVAENPDLSRIAFLNRILRDPDDVNPIIQLGQRTEPDVISDLYLSGSDDDIEAQSSGSDAQFEVDPSRAPGLSPALSANGRRASMADREIVIEWQRITGLREQTWGLRSKLQQQRAVLRAKQHAKSFADDELMKCFHSTSAATEGRESLRGGKGLEELLGDCQKARDEYGPLEDECNMLEDQLGSLEFQLTRLEQQFFGKSNSIFADTAEFEDKFVTSLEPEVQSECSELDFLNDRQRFHPLVVEYLSKMGDLDLLRERLEDHRDEISVAESERETRQRVNLPLASEDQKLLDNAEETLKNLLAELENAEREAQKCKNECFAHGFMDPDGEPIDLFDLPAREMEAFNKDDVNSGSQRSEYIRFSMLLAHAPAKQENFGTYSPKEEERSDNAGDHINQWLLHQLQCSPMQINLLARTFEQRFGQIDNEHWQSEVLRVWYKDGAIKSASCYQVYSPESTEIPFRSGISIGTSAKHDECSTKEGSTESGSSTTSPSLFGSIGLKNDRTSGQLLRSHSPRSI